MKVSVPVRIYVRLKHTDEGYTALRIFAEKELLGSFEVEIKDQWMEALNMLWGRNAIAIEVRGETVIHGDEE